MSDDLTTGLDPADVAQALVDLDMSLAQDYEDALSSVKLPGIIELRFLALSFQQARRVADAASGSDVAITNMVYNPVEGFELDVQHWAAKLLAESFYKVLDECKEAENYLQIRMKPTSAKGKDLEVVLRMADPDKKTPAELNSILKSQIAKVREDRAALEEKVASLEHDLRDRDAHVQHLLKAIDGLGGDALSEVPEDGFVEEVT